MIDIDEFLTDNQTSIFTCGLLLPLDQEACAIEISHTIDEQNPQISEFRLDKVIHPPYVRLYETVLPQNTIEKAYNLLHELAEKTTPFTLKWGETEQTQHFLAVWGEINPSIQSFHELVLKIVNPLRAGHFKQKYIEDRNEHLFSSEEEASFEKWGSPWAEPYVPHMIINKAKSPGTFNINNKIPEWDFKNCSFRGLLVGVRTEHGDFSHSSQLNFVT